MSVNKPPGDPRYRRVKRSPMTRPKLPDLIQLARSGAEFVAKSRLTLICGTPSRNKGFRLY